MAQTLPRAPEGARVPASASASGAPAPPIDKPRRPAPWPVAFYRSAIGKKWLMGLSGVFLMVFVVGHLIGNLKLYLGRGELDLYGEALRSIPGHLLPRTLLLWVVRVMLIGAFAVHIQAAVSLTRMNQKARSTRYQSPRDYVAASYASRTMRWSGVIVLLYLAFHLMDLTWGVANPQFVRGDPYNNLIFSLQRPVVAVVYTVANLALGLHLWHGAWSMFQSLGINNPRINAFRRWFARSFAAVIVIGNLSFPVLIQAHVIEPTCSANRTPKAARMCPTSSLPGHTSSTATKAG